MHPLPAHTVQLVLQYIAPLSDPIPPHLISTPLNQRHHFLQISPSSPRNYLCWPSPDNAKIIDLLDHLQPPSEHASFPTRYTSDSESIFAHAQISSDAHGLRVLFHWDDIHGWMYHDLRLMPFPSPSYSTPQDSLATSSACEAAPPHPSPPEAKHVDNGDDDSYWDAYGESEHDSTFSSPPQNTTDSVEGEDTYWAQYASVQGTADSTVPSPLPAHRKFRPATSTVHGPDIPFPPQDNPIIDVPVDVVSTHSRSLPPGLEPEPPSPNMLAHLLGTISPRKGTYSPSLDNPDSMRSFSAHGAGISPEQTTGDSELVSLPVSNGYLDASVVSPAVFELNGVPPSKLRSRSKAEDTALSDSIKGLYYLWKAGRNGESDEKDTSVFLRIVQAAIASE